MKDREGGGSNSLPLPPLLPLRPCHPFPSLLAPFPIHLAPPRSLLVDFGAHIPQGGEGRPFVDGDVASEVAGVGDVAFGRCQRV
jgi:hypothetical protein